MGDDSTRGYGCPPTLDLVLKKLLVGRDALSEVKLDGISIASRLVRLDLRNLQHLHLIVYRAGNLYIDLNLWLQLDVIV